MAAPVYGQATPQAVVTAPGDTLLTVTADRTGITARQRAVPSQLNAAQRLAYQRIFLDIEAGRTSRAETALNALAPGLLHETARGQLIAARGAGRLTRADLAAWLSANADLPQAAGVVKVAQRLRGSEALPLLPSLRPMRYASFNPPLSPRSETGPGDAGAAATLKPLLAADRNAEAEAGWRSAEAGLSTGARTEWAHKVAWSYYGQTDNVAARRMGLEAARGMGPWAALGAWTAGLAAWRQGQYDDAARAFDLIASRLAGDDRNQDLVAAGAYWASRAYLAAGRPDLVPERLETAARVPDSFYGLLARRALGLAPVQDWVEPDFITADWNHLNNFKGAKRAAALVEIGQIGLADRELKHLAQTAPAANYSALLRLAARLGLPATQYQLSVRPPVGIEPPLSARFPAPEWEPARGWRVDKGLVFAHALQESNFITTATSRAGAKGIMQLMPGTARQVAAEMNSAGAATVVGDLGDPAFNIEVGQTYLEALRDMSYTEGLLPKVVAAYNAGPGSVQRWNTSLDDRGDPLLFIASIPFRETRHYVEVVMRNYWMYQLRDGIQPESIDALVRGLWPKFPGMPGAKAVKRAPPVIQILPSQPEPQENTVTAALDTSR
ncbi:lytic transglycosylase domain-containing protein [Polymorphobacter sp.]|uniref:lytic transglycosylase domain-containing protein n=1 Tax=Polymorphobacter sp. TaxID=1909290 RepID=UPI003F706D3C